MTDRIFKVPMTVNVSVYVEAVDAATAEAYVATLKNKNPDETGDALRNRTGDSTVTAIGPATRTFDSECGWSPFGVSP